MKKVYSECLTVGCTNMTLELSLRMTAARVGDFSLAGAQMKFSVQTIPYLECPKCDGFVWGTIDGRTGEALFDKTKWETQ